MDDNKFFGFYGYGSGYFKVSWFIIGKDVIDVILEFFEKGKLLRQLNIIQVCVVFKIDIFIFFGDNRLIVYCNILQKVIFKIWCNRIKIVLFYLVFVN